MNRKIFSRMASSVIILLPILAGVILWDKLPQQLPIHWGVNGQPDGYAGKAVAVFLMPLILLAIHWMCMIATAMDRKNKVQNPKIMGMIYWIVPLLSLAVNGIVYSAALGKSPDVGMVVLLILGLMFAVIGNYMPKCRPNRTVGIRIRWTLQSEANWNATHRLGGKVWVIGGFLCIAGAFLPQNILPWFAVAVLLAVTLIPTVYSYVYYKKHGNTQDEGEEGE